jgi:hypothetical protein
MEREAEDNTENTVTAEFHPPGLESRPENDQETTLEAEAQVTPLHPNAPQAPPEVDFNPVPAGQDEYHTEPTEQMPSPLQDVAPVPLPIDPLANTPSAGGDAAEADAPQEPEYQGAGRWSELPLPNAGAQELPTPAPAPTPARPKREHTDQGPVAEFFGRALSMIRSDAYLMFLGAAGLVIVVLLGALWLLPAS